MKTRLVFTVVLAILLAACTPLAPGSSGGGQSTAVVITAVAGTVMPGLGGGTAAPLATPEPPTPIPPLPSGLSPTELKYRVLDEFPDFFFCDPDTYPVARDDEGRLAVERFPEIQANTEEFQAILSYNGLSSVTEITDEQKLLIYQQHKKLAAIPFELIENVYHFQVQTALPNGEGFLQRGTIDGGGEIKIEDAEPTIAACPICLAAGTGIETPNGTIAVEDLHVGGLVWTLDASGRRMAAPVSAVTRVPVPGDHQMVHLLLDDVRELWASPDHPTTDGRRLGDLLVGDLLDGSHILIAERVDYDGSYTYDLLPSGGTGFYWANGILMGSTLNP